MMNVYIAIGNSDDKLPQAQWASYCVDIERMINTVQDDLVWYGKWYSLSNAPYQNACFSFGMSIDIKVVNKLKGKLRFIAAKYNQESIAMMTGTNEMVNTGL